MHDLLVRGADVVDGTDAPPRRMDVAVANGTIGALGREFGAAPRVIDAPGHVLARGFIDTHTHSDYSLLANRRAKSKIRQDVTTEVVGNCGYSVAPVPAGPVGLVRDYLAASGPWYDFRETTFGQYVDEGEHTGALPGRLRRRGSDGVAEHGGRTTGAGLTMVSSPQSSA